MTGTVLPDEADAAHSRQDVTRDGAADTEMLPERLLVDPHRAEEDAHRDLLLELGIHTLPVARRVEREAVEPGRLARPR